MSTEPPFDEGGMTPERTVRLLRAKVGEMESYVRAVADDPDPTVVAIAAVTADVALIAHLLARHIERTETAPPSDCPEGFEVAGAIWNCSARCWQEGGPHDDTCKSTNFYSRKVTDEY